MISAAWIRRIGEIFLWHGGFRFLALGSAVWAARCLGPYKLGISGMIQASCAQLVLLICLNQDNALIRTFKADSSPDLRRSLIDETVSFRLFACLAAGAAALVVCLFGNIDPNWRLPLAAGIPLLFAHVNQPLWLLQARDKTVINYRLGAFQGVLIFLGYVIFIRPGAEAGYDVLLQGCGMGIAALLGWTFALDGLPARVTFRNAMRMFGRIWENRWLAVSGIAIYIYTAASLPLLGYFGRLEEAGEYRTAMMMAGIVQQANSLIFVVLYPKFIDWHRQDPLLLWHRQCQIAKLLAVALLPVVAALFFVLPRIYPYLFGAEYSAAAYPCALLITSKCIVMISGVFSFGLWAQSRDRALALLVVVTAVFSLLANLSTIPRFGMLGCATVDLLCEGIIFVTAITLAYRPILTLSRERGSETP